jgi:hypothetical protein
VIIRPDRLRGCKKKAAKKNKKLNSRLSPDEKRDRKRMAHVAAVYTVLPHIKTAESIMRIALLIRVLSHLRHLRVINVLGQFGA